MPRLLEKPLRIILMPVFSFPANPRTAMLSHVPPKLFCRETPLTKSNASFILKAFKSSRVSSVMTLTDCGSSNNGTSVRVAPLTIGW